MTVLGAAAAAFDKAMLAAVRAGNRSKSRAEKLDHEGRMKALEAIRASYEGGFDDFFVPPKPIDPALEHVRDERRFEVIDAAWPSLFEPHLPELREKYLSHTMNLTARARLYVGRTARPAIVLIHGYMAGQWAIEERAWPIAWLAERYDLALAVLPFHAVRGAKDRRGPPPFPGADPRMTNEGFRQAMFDLRALVRFLEARGAPSVGVMGMSLGGYSTSLLATVERELAFAVPIIPLASLADFAQEQGRLGSGEEAKLQHAALEEANRIVSPLARPSLVPSDRVLVVAAASDRITPISHAERLAKHFGSELVRFEGGHLLQFGRGQAFRAIGRWLQKVQPPQ
jgi:pimeloyl-ACP methyl ester carboxylesterase